MSVSYRGRYILATGRGVVDRPARSAGDAPDAGIWPGSGRDPEELRAACVSHLERRGRLQDLRLMPRSR